MAVQNRIMLLTTVINFIVFYGNFFLSFLGVSLYLALVNVAQSLIYVKVHDRGYFIVNFFLCLTALLVVLIPLHALLSQAMLQFVNL